MPFDINGIGGNVLPTAGDEKPHDIKQNTTLVVTALTDTPPVKPEVIKGLTTTDEVLKHYKPAVALELETEDGTIRRETVRFEQLKDFGITGISKQSPLLNELTRKKEQYHTITRQLKTNKRLQQALNEETTRQAFISALQALIEELDEPAGD